MNLILIKNWRKTFAYYFDCLFKTIEVTIHFLLLERKKSRVFLFSGTVCRSMEVANFSLAENTRFPVLFTWPPLDVHVILIWQYILSSNDPCQKKTT